MEACMSLNAVVRLPLSSSRTAEDGVVRHSLFASRTTTRVQRKRQQGLVVEAKGRRGMQDRMSKRAPPPPLPKIEDDGNPKFVIFIRIAGVNFWYPLSIISGGTTAKIMLAAKDNFVGKYIYKDALARNLGAVIYKDEKDVQKTAFKQFKILQTAKEFRYGYKIVDGGNLKSALATNDVIELPSKEQLKTVLDKVKDFFGDAKESFGKMTAINASAADDDS